MIAALRWMVTPTGAAVLAAVLLADAAVTVRWLRGKTAVGSVAGWASRAPLRVNVNMRTDGDAPEVIDESFSSTELVGLIFNTPEHVLQVDYAWDDSYAGLWMPALRRRFGRLYIYPIDKSRAVTPEVEAAVRRCLADYLDRHRLATQATRVRAGDYDRTTVVVWGIAHDVLAAGAVLLIAAALVRIPARVRTRRVERARARGRCAGCGYDVSGVPRMEGVVRCPECGAAWAG